MIRELCEKHTDLNEEDILQLIQLNDMLPYFCELSNADIFLDCFLKGEEKAIVVAHIIPEGDSLYKNTAVGQIALPQNEPVVFFARQTGQAIRDIKGLTQENKVVLQRAVPIKNKSNIIIGMLIEEQDMTKSIYSKRKIDELGKVAEQFTETILTISGNQNIITNHIRSGIITFNDEHSATYANTEAERIYRQANFNKGIIGRSFKTLSPDPKISVEEVLSGKVSEYECIFGDMILSVKCSVPQNSSVAGIIMLLEDISDIKRKEKELVQKTIAVQEMHHRIKNNLQIISSILSIQERRSNVEETKKVLRDNVGRISSIAAIHELLINSMEESTGLLNLIKKLTDNIKSYVITDEKKIDIAIVGEEMELSGDVAVSVAIVLNELITNAIEHGFKSKNEGKVIVSVNSGLLYSTITVEDNGTGFVVGDTEKRSIGLDLVEITVREKLKGELKINSSPRGTIASFDFNVK